MSRERVRPATQRSFLHKDRIRCTYIDVLGTIKAAGPEQSEIKFDDGRERVVANYHLRHTNMERGK